MHKPTALTLAGIILLSGCDLPTSADEAREYLGRDQEERIVPLRLPLPSMTVSLSERLAELSDIVDTTDLSFRLDPDSFTFALDSLLRLDPIDPAPDTLSYDLAVADFERTVDIAVPSVPLTLPGTAVEVPLPPPFLASAMDTTFPMDMSGSFATADFAAGSMFRVALTTDASSSVTGVAATIEQPDGTVIASSSGTVSLGPSSTDTLWIDLSDESLPSQFNVRLSIGSGSSTSPATDNLAVDIGFQDAEVVGATGVDVDRITPVDFSERVALDVTGADFSQATLAAGTVALTSYDIGTLELDATFAPSDLSGLQVGPGSPDSLTVSGSVRAPAGAAVVDISTQASLTVSFTGLEVASVTLNQVDMSVDQSVTVPTDGALDGLGRITLADGALELEVVNRLGIGGQVTLTLTGATDASGNVISHTFTLQPSPDGTPVTTPTTVDLAGAVIRPDSLAPRFQGTITGTDVTVTPAAAAEAVITDALLTVEPQSVELAGQPDMAVTLDQRVTIASSDIELGEQLSDFVESVQFNDVTFTVTVENGTGLDLQVDSFRLTLLDAAGAPVTDTAGDPVVATLGSGTSTSVVAPAGTSTVLEANAVAFVNALLNQVAAGQDVMLAAVGTAGPAADTGTISVSDELKLTFAIAIAPDFTLDATGITFDQVTHEALTLDSIASEFMANLSQDLQSAALEFEAINGMPLGLAVTMALAPTPADTTGFDPFTAPGGITLATFQIDPATVDATGAVTEPTISSPSIQVEPGDLDIFGEGTLSLGMRAELLPPPGGRARLQPSDSLTLKPLLMVEIRVGGSTGGTE